MMIINPSGNISGEEILIELQEDGRATYELDLLRLRFRNLYSSSSKR